MDDHTPARPCTFGLAPRAAAALARDGALDGDGLLRSIMSHARWLVPGDGDYGPRRVAVLSTPEGGRIVEIFSDDEALSAFARREGSRPDVFELPGHALFGALAATSVDRIKIDVHEGHHFSYGRDQLPLLAAWAERVRTEVALYEPDRVHDPLRVLWQHPEYLVPVHHVEGDAELVFAPDDDERALAALFTADDVATEFVEAMTPWVEGELELVRQKGEAVFRMLGALDIDGVVFNPFTSLPARALDAAVIPRILDAGRRLDHATH